MFSHRKLLKLTIEQSLYLNVDGKSVVNGSIMLDEVHRTSEDADGFLNISYSSTKL